MAVQRDFDLRIPERAVRIANTELLPLFRDYLLSHGIADPSNYDHYQIRIVVEPRRVRVKEEHPSLFDWFNPVSRKQKKVSFASADSIFITLEPSDSDIELREAFPPTTDEEGSFSGEVSGKIGVGGGVAVTGVRATADLQASIRKQFKPRKFVIFTQVQPGLAIWDFRHPWIRHNAPELHITCSVHRDLPAERRFVRCQRRVSAGKRALLAPKEPRKIWLPEAPK
jgi:hypothetical protein